MNNFANNSESRFDSFFISLLLKIISSSLLPLCTNATPEPLQADYFDLEIANHL